MDKKFESGFRIILYKNVITLYNVNKKRMKVDLVCMEIRRGEAK